MATTEADRGAVPGLSQIRRLEAAAFRAWPSASTYYDGTWSIRLTPGHPSRRLNSINPLDPNDHSELDGRIARAELRFATAQKPLTFRQTPLASRELEQYLHDEGFSSEHESCVMAMPLTGFNPDQALNQIPLKDVMRYAQASIEVRGQAEGSAEALASVIASIVPPYSLFVHEDAAGPVSTVMCVQDGDLAGILDLGTRTDARRQGHGASALATALKWARNHGALMAWLQVELESDPALALYKDFGFEEVYRYVYRIRARSE
jgi:ribosomal protein S18 acetylase RimI-like enzyme